MEKCNHTFFCLLSYLNQNTLKFKVRSSLMYFLQLIFNLLCIYRDELGQKAGVSSGNAKAGHTDMDGSLFHNGTKADGKNTLSALIFTFCFRRNSAFWDFMNKFKCKASLTFNCVFARPITHYLYYENDMQIFRGVW